MSQHYRRRRRRITDMNVVPYIDVMLVLLIIFMITSPLLSKSVDVELPNVKKATTVSSSKTEIIIVSINAQGQLFINSDTKPLSTEQLMTRITALRRLSSNSSVLVRGDSSLAYGEIVKVMSLLQGIGVAKVGLMTKPLK
ncbi:protein TolR [Candidatus Marithrix sp. Canyon 246]|uniref:protein TolR n=1 Tax=Candidatus Marithrix sp. Canyon 246 TaxID=1827136 RepID=UPI00084A1484|nr:protein TolR [Candidatus Marithrix sp. Canyon 246]